MVKTNAMRLLDLDHVPYRGEEYEPDEDHLLSVEDTQKIGLSADEVFKTLVTRGDKNGINVFCIPLNCELDLKKAAVVSKNKKIEMIHVKEILQLTGYVRGGCSPIGMKKKYPTFIDETAFCFDEIGISAGAWGSEIIINGEVLCNFLEGELVDLVK